MTELSKMLIASYPVPLVMDGYTIKLYLYNKENYKEILFSKEYYEHIPKNMLADNPAVTEIDKFCLDLDNEFVICINEDLCSPDERVNALAACLFAPTKVIAEDIESEEFGARLIGDMFKTMAPLLQPELLSMEASTKRGMCIAEYPFPLKSEGYRITFNMYERAKNDDLLDKLRDRYRERILSGRFSPFINYGFTAEPNEKELGIFVNCDNADSLLMQEVVLAHELFHAAIQFIKTFDNSTELGARLYATLFAQFSDAMLDNVDR